MNALQEQLLKTLQPRQIWYVEDKAITFGDDQRTDKSRRPVLIVSTKELLKKVPRVVNVVPLTTSVRGFDKYTLPVERGFINIAAGFDPKSISSAVINYFQPLAKDCFIERCAELNDETYHAIRIAIANDVIGIRNTFDLSI